MIVSQVMKSLPQSKVKEILFFAMIVLPMLVTALMVHSGNVLVTGMMRNMMIVGVAFLDAYALNRVFA